MTDAKPTGHKDTRIVIRSAYLYIALLVSLITMIISGGQLLSSALRAYVFTKADLDRYGIESPPFVPTATSPDVIATKTTLAAENRADLVKRVEAWEVSYADWEKRNNIPIEERRARGLQSDAANSLPYFIIAALIFAGHSVVLKRDKKNM